MFLRIPLMPHAVCWRADPPLIWVMVITNAITSLSYLGICVTLLYLIRCTRRVIAGDWAYFVVGFALFILACGSTHLMEVVTTWWPFFWIDAAANIVTAGLSAYVAIMLSRRVGTIGFSINDYAQRLANTEREKRQMLDSLLAAQKLEDWSRLSTVVAHEIANPLEAIQNLLYLIRSDDSVSEQVVALVKSAADEADRVLAISRSTLSFFRQGGMPELIDLGLAAESVKFLMETTMRTRGIKLRIEIDEAEGAVVVDAIPGEPRQVLLNLIRNAYEATPQHGEDIRLKLTGKVDAVEIIVADRGSGIDPKVLNNVFQFGLTTKGEHGNGVGLWAIKHILSRHGGDIQVSSEFGKGTAFTLRWPRHFVSEASGSEVLPHAAQ